MSSLLLVFAIQEQSVLYGYRIRIVIAATLRGVTGLFGFMSYLHILLVARNPVGQGLYYWEHFDSTESI